MSLPFLSNLSQFGFFGELYEWSILTGWAAVLLILDVIAFFVLGTSRTRNAWWQYVALLLTGCLGLWSLVVAYNSYQDWTYFNTLLPVHGINLAYMQYIIGPPYHTAIQTCQLQFALTSCVLVLLIGVAGWQFWRAFTKKIPQAQLVSNRHIRFWMSFALFVPALYCLAYGVFLITQLYLPLIYEHQMIPFQFDEPTTLELIGLYTVSLGGPLILLLRSATTYVERCSMPRMQI